MILDLGMLGWVDAASYCIPRGTAYDPLADYSVVCDKHGTHPATDCGNGRKNP